MLVVMPRRTLPFLVASLTVVLVSILAYAGGIPSFVSRLGLDKVLHAAMGFSLTYLLARALRGRAALAGALVMLPLAIDEYLQRFSAARSSDWGDLLADLGGITLAVALSAVFTARATLER